jgi:MerR family transcriptional regulator, light-induced transcriptional regulator
MNAFTIKDLENLSGIKAHTIRVWEQRYSFLKPQRTRTNIRFYNNQELKSLLNISLLHKHGYKISHIDRMKEHEVKEKIRILAQSVAHEESMVNELIHYMIDLDMDRFEVVLDKYVMTWGIDKAIGHIIFPFLDRIGILWVTNHINPTQEHLVTNIIRQKLIVGIESMVTAIRSDQTILLFLPEGEHHELGLLYIYYLLKSRGIKVLYLGADVPVKDIEYLCSVKRPDQLYTHLTCIAGNFNFEKFLQQIHKRIPGVTFTISGRLAETQVRKIPPGFHFKKSLAEVVEYIDCL